MRFADTERAVRAWATAEHTLHDGHDCIRCQVARLLAVQDELIDALKGLLVAQEAVTAAIEGQLRCVTERLRDHELTLWRLRSSDDDDD
jgi:uncharacterized coiled-coil protein SlyX